MIVLPLIAFVLLFLMVRKKGIDRRRAFLVASTLWGTSVVLITEVLSVPTLVSRGGVAVSWLVICVICLVIYWKLKAVTGFTGEQAGNVAVADDELDGATKFLLGVTGVIVVMVGITALLAPPATIDGMTYHMPRVAMWINNHNVRFFPTVNYTQLIYGSFAEYSILHTMLLWGNDRFANMIQFFSFVGCAIAVSYLVKLMGGSKRAQTLAAVISITIPEGILEASGAMNTYSATFWIAATTAFLLLLNEDASWLNTTCIGLAAGLAIFTKGTTYIMLPFFVLACWWASSRGARILFLKRSAVFLVLILALNAPQYVRDYKFDGSPLGLPLNYGEVNLTVQNIGIRSTVANVLRYASLHMGTPLDSLNSRIERGFRAALRVIGMDPDDPRQVVWEEKFLINHTSFQELLAGNPLDFILLAIALGIIFIKRRRPENRIAFWYALGLTAAFVAFCGIVKWQRWSSRFLLCFFVMGAVVIALALVRYFPRGAVTAIVVALLVWGLVYASMNRYRALIPVGRWQSAWGPRSRMYFTYELDYLAPSYIAAAEAVDKTDCASVGVDSYIALADPDIKRSPDSFFTYPILALIHADGVKRTAFFAGVHNLTARYAAQQPHPPACAIVCLECAKIPAKWEQYHAFPNQLVFENTVVFSGANVDAR